MPVDAILFIPGFCSTEQDLSLYELAKRFEARRVIKVKDRQADNGSVISFQSGDGTVDVYEMDWSDFVEDLSKKDLSDKFGRGLFLFLNWVISPIWSVFAQSFILTIGSVLYSFLFVGWYVSTGYLIFSEIVKEFKLDIPPIISGWIWLITTLLVALLPINLMINKIDFCTRYLEGGLTRDKVRARAVNILTAILSKDYNAVTVLAHSFGTLIGLDLVTALGEDQRLRYITLGSAAKFLSHKSRKIKGELSALMKDACKTLGNREWIEYYSDDDPLCMPWPAEGEDDMRKIEKIELRDVKKGKAMRWIEIMTAEYHNTYLCNDNVWRTIRSDHTPSAPGASPDSGAVKIEPARPPQ